MNEAIKKRGARTAQGLALASFLFCAAIPADELDQLREQWRSGQYEEVLPRLLEYMERPYGREPEVLAMTASCACRIGGDWASIGERFFGILSDWDLGVQGRRWVERESRICRNTEQPPQELLVAAGPRILSAAGVSSKMFYAWTGEHDIPLLDNSARVVRKLDPDVFRARLFPPEQAAQGVEVLTRLVGPGHEVVASGSFLLAGARHSGAELVRIGEELDRVADFFVERFGMRRPEHLISVYLVPSVGDLRRLAKRLHGIDIPDSSIGYSFREDMSLLGVVPGHITGTLKHELFHLMVRNRYGDIPPWLDEGMAALYEVSRFADGELRGLPNWRGPVLEHLWAWRPSVAELVESDWPVFQAAGQRSPSMRIEQQAANHATARYLARYLQERDRLASFFRAMQERPLVPRAGEDRSASQLLETVLGMDLEETDTAFEDWFNAEVGRHHRSARDVRTLQRQLARAGYDPRGADGVIGANTRAAIRAYQAEQGLQITGELDLYTRLSLRQ